MIAPFKQWLVKVIDFGLARIADMNTITSAGEFGGTIDFLPPEIAQMHGFEIFDQKADIYSLAIVLYLMLKGHLPREFAGNNDIERLRKFLEWAKSDEPTFTDEQLEGLPDKLKLLLKQMGNKSWLLRLGSYGQIREMIEDILLGKTDKFPLTPCIIHNTI